MADIIVVASKVKKLFREKAGMNTSADVLESLSRKVEQLCLEGIERAKADRRKTVKGRDFPD